MGFLLEALRELGREDGRDFNFTGRFAEFNVEQLPALAEEIVQLNPAVIVCGAVHGCGGPQATSSIPILSGSRRCHPPRASRQLCPPGWECDRHHALCRRTPRQAAGLAREIVPGAKKVGIIGNRNDPKARPSNMTSRRPRVRRRSNSLPLRSPALPTLNAQ